MALTRSAVRIAKPCGADWREMSPRGAARLCQTCDTLVHDLSAMTERDARSLLASRPVEGLCIRYLHDENGEIWFGERVRERIVPAGSLVRRAATLATAAAFVLTPVLTEACGGASPYTSPDRQGFGDGDASSDADAVHGFGRATATPIVSDAADLDGSSSPDGGVDALGDQ